MTYYDEVKTMPIKWIESQLKWMEMRQADSQSCSFAGEDRLHKIRVLKEILANHQKKLTK